MTANEIKAIKALGTKKGRDEAGLFVVEGEKMVQEALASSFKVKAVYRREEIGEKAMERISSLSSPSPVLAVVEKPSSMMTAPARIPGKQSDLTVGCNLAARNPAHHVVDSFKRVFHHLTLSKTGSASARSILFDVRPVSARSIG